MRNGSWLMWMVATGCVVGGGEQDLVYEDLSGVTMELGSGDVEVVGELAQGSTSEIHLDLGGVGTRNARGLVELDDQGWLYIDARGGLLGGGSIEANVPAGLPVEVLLDRGDVWVHQEAAADVSACVAAGSVEVEVPEGGYRLDLKGGAGAVRSEGVWHDPDALFDLTACVGAGDLAVFGTP